MHVISKKRKRNSFMWLHHVFNKISPELSVRYLDRLQRGTHVCTCFAMQSVKRNMHVIVKNKQQQSSSIYNISTAILVSI